MDLDIEGSEFDAAFEPGNVLQGDTPAFNEALGRVLAAEMFEGFFAHDPYARLTDLEVCFGRSEVGGWGNILRFPIKMQRLERETMRQVLSKEDISSKVLDNGLIRRGQSSATASGRRRRLLMTSLSMETSKPSRYSLLLPRHTEF